MSGPSCLWTSPERAPGDVRPALGLVRARRARRVGVACSRAGITSSACAPTPPSPRLLRRCCSPIWQISTIASSPGSLIGRSPTPTAWRRSRPASTPPICPSSTASRPRCPRLRNPARAPRAGSPGCLSERFPEHRPPAFRAWRARWGDFDLDGGGVGVHTQKFRLLHGKCPQVRNPRRLTEASKSVGSNGETVLGLKAEKAFGVGSWTFDCRCRLL